MRRSSCSTHNPCGPQSYWSHAPCCTPQTAHKAWEEGVTSGSPRVEKFPRQPPGISPDVQGRVPGRHCFPSAILPFRPVSQGPEPSAGVLMGIAPPSVARTLTQLLHEKQEEKCIKNRYPIGLPDKKPRLASAEFSLRC